MTTTGRGRGVGLGGAPCPGLVVAAPHSGAGKTTFTLGLIAAAVARGLAVQPFKVGPDFLDTGHLGRAARRPARNLDTWLTSAAYVGDLVERVTRDADLAVVEGMMGLFDGVDGGSDRGSTAEAAALLGWPVVLVVDAGAAARSVAAVVHGFRTFSPRVRVAGIVFNRVAGPGHLRMLEDACAEQDVALLGGLTPDQSLAVAERHLGLAVAGEPGTPPDYAAFARAVAAGVDLEATLRLAARGAGASRRVATTRRGAATAPSRGRGAPRARSGRPRCRIAVARDEAFCFYYEDNLEQLRAAGAELVAWSPLSSTGVPGDVHGLYLGGGYPELHARRLRPALRRAVRRFAVAGGMVYAECGGFMFLQRAIRLLDGAEAPMAGLFPGVTAMQPQLAAIGYREVEATLDGRVLALRGQEFRHSRLVAWPQRAVIDGEPVRLLVPPAAGFAPSGAEGFAWRNVLAGYLHLHFASGPALAEVLVARAERFQRGGLRGGRPGAGGRGDG